jgi:hypothetical protein
MVRPPSSGWESNRGGDGRIRISPKPFPQLGLNNGFGVAFGELPEGEGAGLADFLGEVGFVEDAEDAAEGI